MALPRIQMSGKDPAHYKAYKKKKKNERYCLPFLTPKQLLQNEAKQVICIMCLVLLHLNPLLHNVQDSELLLV